MYQRTFSFGEEPLQSQGSGQQNVGVLDPAAFDMPPVIDDTGNGQQPGGVAAAGLLGLFGGIALLALALPFGIGAAAGAVVAPSGRRKSAAKSGAWVGGIGGLVAYPLVHGVTGSSPLAQRLTGIAPMVLGGYMGYRERQKAEDASGL